MRGPPRRLSLPSHGVAGYANGAQRRRRDRAFHTAHYFRPRPDMVRDRPVVRDLCGHHLGPGQPRHHRAGRRRHCGAGRRARSGRGAQGHRLEHHRHADRADDHHLDRPAFGRVPVCRRALGAARPRASGRASPAGPAGDVLRLRSPQQCQHGAADGAGDACRHPRIADRAVSIPDRRSAGLQYRRHGDADRRSAEYHDRLAGGLELQQLSLSSGADRRGGSGRAGADAASDLGPRHAMPRSRTGCA